jgi:tetratricopeptide (TPR) repeat protein
VVNELRDALARAEADGTTRRRSPRQSTRSAGYIERRLTAAAEAYEHDRYDDALSAIRPVLERAPDAPAVKELYGLILYRLGRWRQAAKSLSELHDLTGSFDQFPVVADCERALGHTEKVQQLWDELRRSGAEPEVLVEGRLVMAGALADSGRIDKAIELLQPEGRNRKNPSLWHLRQWYALADLYEKGGDLPRARQLFGRIAQADPAALDAPERLRALR